MKSGFVSIIGRPNTGKSTLLNSIVGEKIAIISEKPQTTRNLIQGIYNEEDCQIVFVDTPGIHKPTHKLGQYLNKQAYISIDDVDVILFLVDAKEKIGPGDKFIIDRLKTTTKPVILVINKIDKLSKEEIYNKIVEYKDLMTFAEIVPLSALKDNNIDTLIKVLKNYLPDNVKYFEDNQITNRSTSFLISEIVREQVFNLTGDEIPHSVTCVVERVGHKKGSTIINVAVIVDRDALKKIIIGKHGQKIKDIGMKARPYIEELLNEPVYLELYVKTIEKWRDKEKYLAEFGYNDFE